MTNEGSTIFRDPIHGNIKILPFELKIIGLKIFFAIEISKTNPISCVCLLFFESHKIGTFNRISSCG